MAGEPWSQDEVGPGPVRGPDPFAPPATVGPFQPPPALGLPEAPGGPGPQVGPGGPSAPVGPGWPGRPGWPGAGGRTARAKRKGRPAFGLVVAGVIVLRGGREVVGQVAGSEWGLLGVLAVSLAFVALVLAWRGLERRRIQLRGGVEFTPELVAKQIADSELWPPAFPEDGSVLGASLLVVNQNSKVLELNTTYEVFGSNGARIGTVHQIGQSRAKMAARALTAFDQFFTHHFDVLDPAGRPVLRLTRPAKVFLTQLHVFAGDDRYIGTIRQENVFWKIRFAFHDEHGGVVGYLRAENVRAWDFHVYDVHRRIVATLAKSWEGWTRTTFTRADRYVVRVHEPLAHPLRELTVAAALVIDLALKQDTRGFS